MNEHKPEIAHIAEHEFQPVAGHPDDDECTHRADGTDGTYCGQPRAWHDHHPRCYQNTSIPDDLPDDLCDCRVLRLIAVASDGLTPEERLLRAIFGNDHEESSDG